MKIATFGRGEERRVVYQSMIPSQLLLSSQCGVQHSRWSDELILWVESFLSALQSLPLHEQITLLNSY